MAIGYYPGCALHGTSNDYEQSVKACLGALGVPLEELKDWICCGATAAHALNEKLALALPSRNLAIAGRDGYGEVLAPCPMCSMELLKASALLARDEGTRAQMSQVVELEISGRPRVINLIQLFQRFEMKAVKPLEGFVAACYYGCLLVRPPDVVRFDDPEQPSSMEKILEGLGAKTVAWGMKTECCGAGMTLCDEDTVLELAHRILANARAHGANCLVVACPMCHVNLDLKQAAVEKAKGVTHGMPVYYLSDLIGLALGLSEEQLGIDRHFVAGGVHV